MVSAKLSGSLLARRDAPPPTTPQRPAVPESIFVGRSLANRFESADTALYASDGIDGPVPAQAAAATGNLPASGNYGWGPIRVGLAIGGVAAAIAVGVYLFRYPTAPPPLISASQANSASPSAADVRPTAAPTAQGHIAIPAGTPARTAPAATPTPGPSDLSVQPTTPVAIGKLAVSPTETTPDTQLPKPSAEPQAPAAGASAPAVEPNPAVASARLGAPSQPAQIGRPTTPVAASEPPPTAVVTPISPQREPDAAGSGPAPAQPPATRLPAGEVVALLARGDLLFGNGDIASARLFYERAAEGGDSQAALRLGETYDPVFLTRARLNGVRGDAAAAARWYRRAHQLGAAEADILLPGAAADAKVTERSENDK